MKDTRKFLILAAIVGLLTYTSVFAQDEFCPTDLTSPVKGTVSYRFMSDYMWRGLNMTDVWGGSKGRGAQELTYGLTLDLADVGVDDVGTVGVTLTEAYFSSFAGTDASKAFTDFDITLTRACPWTGGTWTIGYSNYKWANSPFAGKERSQEVSAAYSFKDGKILEMLTGNDMGDNVLNPVIQYVLDYDSADGGGLLILGLSHPFDGAQIAPEIAGVTLTPALTLVYDNRYYGSYLDSLTGAKPNPVSPGDHQKMAYLEYALNAGVDLTETLGLTCGKLNLTTGLAYLDGVVITDGKWYGHVGVSYNW